MAERRRHTLRPCVMLSIWRQRLVYRRTLRCMLDDNPHLIADIGLTEAAARAEALRPFWRA